MRNENNTHVVLTKNYQTEETRQCLSACQMGKILSIMDNQWLVDFGLHSVVWVREGQGVPITVGKNGRVADG